ncbi:MAG: EAL domain-containing protein [Epsilonproteobacteria bacterium]|nr:hypothetical protein [Campylobacterota bacterium]NPA56094.1 EAL domain-containing protein [Campylobacterota bacterium]
MGGRFHKELLDLAFRNLKISLFGLLANATIVFFIYEKFVPNKGLLLLWFIAMLTITAARFYYFREYQRHPERRSLEEWSQIFLWLLIISTILWSVASLFTIYIDDLAPLALLAAIYAGVAAGGVLSLAAYLRAAIIFLTLPLGTYILVLLFKGTTHTYHLAFLLTFYYLLLFVVARRLHQQFLELFLANQKYLLEKNIAQHTQKCLKAVFDNSPVGIFFYDKNYKLLDANRSFFEITELSPDLERVPRELINPHSFQRSEERLLEFNDRYLKLLSSPIIRDGELVGAVGIISDITKEQKLLEQTEYQAHYDHLTNIPNRYTLFEHLKDHLKKLEEKRERFAVLFVDLDDFKNINDSLGHHVGDQILVEISNRLKKAIRKSDFIARLGGDEFVIVLPNLDPDLQESATIIHRVTQKLHREISKPIRIDNLTLRLTSSIGVVFVEDHSITPYDIVKFADIAMYHAKRSGKNNTQFFQKEMDLWIKKRLEIESALKNAVKNRELALHYQPIVDCRSDRTVGLEALLRWNNPKFRDVGVEEFIHIAEESGAILEIGKWTIKRALRDFKRLRSRYPLKKIAINISITQFNAPDFVETLTRLVGQEKVPFTAIELEITESIFINNKENAKRIMNELRDLGFSLAIDDFGTGYSSLSYLKYLPFTTLKIDRSFIQDIPDDPDDVAIVDTIISIAKKFGLETVAEGIERDDQREFVKKLGCTYYQGYLKSKPLQYKQIEALLMKERE